MQSPEKILHFFLSANGENSCCQVEIIAGKCVFLCRSLFMFPAKIFKSEPKVSLLSVTIRIIRFSELKGT